MKFIKSVQDLLDYDYFVFDVWGVVHDGSNAYPGAIEAISFLRKHGKKICFLSNAPRRADKIAIVLQKFGVTPDLYDFIMSSGEATFLDLKKNQDEGFKNFGKKYIYIGPQKDIDLLNELDYEQVDSASEASFAINTGFDHDSSIIAEKMPQAIEAKKYNLPMICVNPDMIVVKQDGREMICAGALAMEYKKIGGNVIYYGKPYISVYETVCQTFNISKSAKIIAIGDGLETDIQGAKDFEIDSVLVTGGILSNSLNISYHQEADRSDLEKILNKYKLFPQFIISNLKL